MLVILVRCTLGINKTHLTVQVALTVKCVLFIEDLASAVVRSRVRELARAL
jgi:hypothetical protein